MKKLVYNTRERALSNDGNRAIALSDRALGETLRYLMDVAVDANGVSAETLGQTSPLTAEIVNGLLFRPAVGSANATVDPGLVCMIDPEGAAIGTPLGTDSSDNSVYKVVQDVGVPNVGTLALTANSSGSTRIDVVEFKRVSGGNTTSESRDVYDVSSGLFSASTVTKTTADSLTYRIRTGSNGGGFPGTVQGWLPIAVMSVPTGSTTFDTVCVWDVRPMMSDRQGVLNASTEFPELTNYKVNAVDQSFVSGRSESILKGRRVGGKILRGTPGVDQTTFDSLSSANRDPFVALVDRNPWGAWWVLPLGLPTWRRYTDSSTGARLPRGPKGILICSGVQPTSDGAPAAAVTLPTSMGLGAVSTTNCALAWMGIASSTTPGIMYGNKESGTIVAGLAGVGVSPTTIGSGTISLQNQFALTGGTHYPVNAKAVLVEFDLDLNVASGGTVQYLTTQVIDPNVGSATVLDIGGGSMVGSSYPTNGSTNVLFARWMEIPPAPSGATTRAMTFAVTIKNDNAVLTLGTGGAKAKVKGWRL